MVAAESPVAWKNVPDEHLRLWRSIFASSREGVDLSEACPVCGRRTLHRWYYLDRPRPPSDAAGAWLGSGSEWQWCRSCRSYEHYTVLVPDWWVAPFVVDLADLYEDPGSVEEARLQSLQR
jgi:hypothetical protein